jgi:hypothetical protein
LKKNINFNPKNHAKELPLNFSKHQQQKYLQDFCCTKNIELLYAATDFFHRNVTEMSFFVEVGTILGGKKVFRSRKKLKKGFDLGKKTTKPILKIFRKNKTNT